MPITIRQAEAADAAECGAILYAAFQNVADAHNFPRDIPSVEAAIDLVSMLLANPGFYGLVAHDNDRIVGSNFADLRSSIAGIGPISIDPQVQDQGIGRRLMEAAIDHLAATNDWFNRLTTIARCPFTRGSASRRGSHCRFFKDRLSTSSSPDTM